MKLANLDGRPVVIDDGQAFAIPETEDRTADRFIDAINRWPAIVASLDRSEPIDFDPTTLGSPIPRPGKVLGAPVNYIDHKKEMNVEHTVAGLGFFLKSPSSIVGGNGTIELPFPGRRTDHEAELGVVIGRTATNVSVDDALDYVFGYSCLVDVTVRGSEERSTRKSFPGFTPLGPWVTTVAEVPDPTDLRIRGWVNGELRQDESTAQMVYGVAQLIEFMSSVVTLEPGDVIATGTPAGVGPILPGDSVEIEIEQVGRLAMSVSAATREPHPLWLTREVE